MTDPAPPGGWGRPPPPGSPPPGVAPPPSAPGSVPPGLVPPPAPSSAGHPLGVAGLVLSCCTIVPLPVVGGVVGSLLGALGVRAARRSGSQPPTTAAVAVGIGLAFGAIPLLVLTAVRADDWTWVPFGVAVAHVAAVASIASGTRRGAAAGTAGVLGATGLSVAAVFALIAFFVFLAELLWGIVFG